MAFNIFKLFRRKKEETEEIPLPYAVTESVTLENIKAKIDLVSAQLDSLRAESDALNQRLQTMEDMIKEIYNLAKS